MINHALFHPILVFAATTAVLAAAANDLVARIIPNPLAAIVAVCGIGLNGLDHHLSQALFGGGLVFAGGWQCWRRGWIGGGDVKLLTACVLLVRPETVPELIVATALAGAALALSLPKFGRIRQAGTNGTRRSLPYACAIAAGLLLTVFAPIPFP